MYLAKDVYTPYMMSHRFIATGCMITDKSPGTNSVACNYIKVLYHDPRQLNLTDGWNNGNLCPDETSLDKKEWVCM